jgi:hypothetical protein
MIDYYKPDILSLKDDTAAWAAPFISKADYDEIFIPIYDRHARFARERGIPIDFHNCGKCETLMDSLVPLGVRMWNPAQTCNDLEAVKKKYGNQLIICGGWDARGRLLEDGVTDEEIRQSARDSMDKLASGGGYAFCGAFLGAADNENVRRKNAVLFDEVYNYGHSFYTK